jgi:toxin ParE1/3/4
MTLEFLPAAEQELAEATAHYEETELGLGVRFREEVQSTAAAILLHPLLWRQRRGSYRRVNLPGFPYYVAYVLRGQRVRVIAVGHSARQPGYFRNRLRQTPAT